MSAAPERVGGNVVRVETVSADELKSQSDNLPHASAIASGALGLLLMGALAFCVFSIWSVVRSFKDPPADELLQGPAGMDCESAVGSMSGVGFPMPVGGARPKRGKGKLINKLSRKLRGVVEEERSERVRSARFV